MKVNIGQILLLIKKAFLNFLETSEKTKLKRNQLPFDDFHHDCHTQSSYSLRFIMSFLRFNDFEMRYLWLLKD